MSNLFDQRPRVSPNAFVAPSATVVGEVELWDKVSVWYGAVIRGACDGTHKSVRAAGDCPTLGQGRFDRLPAFLLIIISSIIALTRLLAFLTCIHAPSGLQETATR